MTFASLRLTYLSHLLKRKDKSLPICRLLLLAAFQTELTLPILTLRQPIATAPRVHPKLAFVKICSWNRTNADPGPSAKPPPSALSSPPADASSSSTPAWTTALPARLPLCFLSHRGPMNAPLSSIDRCREFKTCQGTLVTWLPFQAIHNIGTRTVFTIQLFAIVRLQVNRCRKQLIITL